MTRLFVAACLLSPLLLSAAEAAPPDINIGQICRRGSVGESNAQEACMKDEQSAKVELAKTWDGIPGDVRKSCTDEVHIGGNPSYVELLTCAEMRKWSREGTGNKGSAGIPPVKP